MEMTGERESDRIRKRSFALISTIFNANNIAWASAEKIDELLCTYFSECWPYDCKRVAAICGSILAGHFTFFGFI
jgi:hypothetical protein